MPLLEWNDADTKKWMEMTVANTAVLRKVRTFILLGQGGETTSSGMELLHAPLQEFGEVSVHDWENAGDVVNVVNAMSPTAMGQQQCVAIIGYSLGANDLGWISTLLKRRVELGVAYDPSRKSAYGLY